MTEFQRMRLITTEVLRHLIRANGPMSISDLRGKVGMDADDFEIREAAWRLVDYDAAQFTDDNKLVALKRNARTFQREREALR